MSAALVLATIHEPVRYSYVGGMVRTKEGLGVVLDGSEAVVMAPNPWDVLALDLRRWIAHQFNHTSFAEATRTADRAAVRVSERWRPFYLALKDLCTAYDRWQNFDYPGAEHRLKAAYAKLNQYVQTAGMATYQAFLEKIKDDLDRLRGLSTTFCALQSAAKADPEGVRSLIVDLVVHAERTCRLAARPDDGVARLYSALEKLAKSALAAYGIDNSAARPEQIPELLREEFLARYRDPTTGRLQFGLEASYRLLAALGDPLGARYQARHSELRKVLDIRNNSLLVHGWRPVDEKIFDTLFAITLDFLGIGQEELPVLPRFPDA